MKKINLVEVVSMLLGLITSCKKGDDILNLSPIEGVYIRNEAGNVIDSLGKPDVKLKDEHFTIKIFGNPFLR